MKDKRIVPNDDVLKYYFYFMQERMHMFWQKIEGRPRDEWTADPILREYKFTNVYRATDRVSQYLIHEVIYKDLDQYSPEDLLLRILIFKIFNKPETWEYLCGTMPEPLTVANFNPPAIAKALTRYQADHPLFNNAYMMAGSHIKYDYLPTKHAKWLEMVKSEIVSTGLLSKILKAKSLEAVYEMLKECSFIGEFLAYQYAIDFNYSPYLNFDENSFVKAGVGAIRGIRKCFFSYGDTYEDAIYYVADNLKMLAQRYGMTRFRPLPNHAPTLIDLQNCFCETDKYLRAKMPELLVGNKRIKQKYHIVVSPIHFKFPTKWHINVRLDYEPLKEVTLFDLI